MSNTTQNTRSQSIDERCAELAKRAMANANGRYAHTWQAQAAVRWAADRIIALRTAEAAQRVEVAQLAGQLGWYVFVGGLLDCDIPASATESEAWELARAEYPNAQGVQS